MRLVNITTNKSALTFALLDSGADNDILSTELADFLGLSRVTCRATVSVLDYVQTTTRDFADLRIESVATEYSVDVKDALIRKNLTGKSDIPPGKRDLSAYPHLQDLQFKDCPDGIGLIISVNHIDTWQGHECRRGKAHQPLGMWTYWGWTIAGSAGKRATAEISCNAMSAEDLILRENIDKIFYNDYPIVSEEELGDSFEHREAIRRIQETIYFRPIRKKYVVGIPWHFDREIGGLES